MRKFVMWLIIKLFRNSNWAVNMQILSGGRMS